MGRLLGIDYGERRIGLAISDITGTIATPLEVVPGNDPPQAAKQIAGIAEAREVSRIIIGLPMRMDGSHGPAAEKAKSFADLVRKQTDIPIAFWDERFSTLTAEQALIEGGARRDKRKQVVDKLAAQIILQHYLDAQPGDPLATP